MMQRCIAPEDLPTVMKHVLDGYEGEYVIAPVRKDASELTAVIKGLEPRWF